MVLADVRIFVIQKSDSAVKRCELWAVLPGDRTTSKERSQPRRLVVVRAMGTWHLWKTGGGAPSAGFWLDGTATATGICLGVDRSARRMSIAQVGESVTYGPFQNVTNIG